MKICTIKQILSWIPCDEWTEDRMVQIAQKHERKKWTALEILSLRDVSHEDRLWVVLREDLIDPKTLRLFACDCADRALERERKAGCEPDKRSWEAIRVARLYIEDLATTQELAAARDAAKAAAWDAARDAARAAAWDAARAAAWDAAWDAARDAARAAAWDAARAAAWDAARAAARDAAWAAAWDAAWAAAWDAAKAAAWDAARDAARAAARDAAWAAAWDAAWDAEQNWQVNRLEEILSQKPKGN